MNTRIKIPAHFDLWMRGARYGTVIRVDKNSVWHVKIDHPQVKRIVKIGPHDQDYCRAV